MRLEYFVPRFLSPSMGPYHDSNLSLAALVTEYDHSLEDILRMSPCKLTLTKPDSFFAYFQNVVIFGSEEAWQPFMQATLRELNGPVVTEELVGMRESFSLSMGDMDT